MNRFANLVKEDYNNPDRLINRYAGEPIFVVGASHSLRQIDVMKMEGFITIGINWTLSLFPSTFIHIIDNHVIKREISTIRKFKDTTVLTINKLSLLLERDCVKFNYIKYAGDDPRLAEKPSETFYFTGNSCSLAINWAYILGGNPIILVGVDLDLKPRYDKILHRFIKGYNTHFWGDGRNKGARSATHGFQTERQAKYLDIIRTKFLVPKGIELINASPFINPEFDVLPRVNYEDIFKKLV